jgi:hypothetical protein
MPVKPVTPKAPTADEQEAEIIRWIQEPIYFGRRFSGDDFDPWSGQEELWTEYGKILNAKLKRYHGAALTGEETTYANKMGISIMAGHGLGKERSIALMGLHYLFVLKTYLPKGVCTAPAGPTLHSTLWPEFGKVIESSPTLKALFTKQSNRIFLKEDKKNGEFMRIEPRTIQQNSDADAQGTVLAGIHAIGVIYLITEASEVAEPVFKPIEGGLTDPLSLIVMIFNPTRRTGFAAESHTKNRKNWICLQWSARTLKKEQQQFPGRFTWFNGNAQDILIEKYGDDSDVVRIRVDGLPPRQSSDTLIHYDAAIAATEREVELLLTDPLCIFIDVGGEGGKEGKGADPSIITILKGPKLLRQVELLNKNTTELSDAVAAEVGRELMALPSDAQVAIGVDTIGIGRGVYDQLVNVQLLQHVYRFDVSESALDEKRFHRLRDQGWWELREGCMETKELVIPADMDREALDTLIAELTSIKWAEVLGKIKVQGKGASSGIPGVKPLAKSPNRGDSLVGAWWLYKHCTSRMPAGLRRMRRIRRKQVSWKAR